MTTKLTCTPNPAPEATRLPNEGGAVVGEWYWVTSNAWNGEPVTWLGCVTYIGSNYVQFEQAGVQHSQKTRVHFDRFEEECKPEPDAARIIDETIARYRLEVARLMGQVQDLTVRLGVGAVRPETESTALALRGDGRELATYKSALVKAKEEDLPALFKEIEENNKLMGYWMKSSLIPLEAAAEALRPAIKKVEDRVFSVELYAGLVEQVEQIADGAPAPAETPIHLYQRRAYMDEECLAQYASGGMEFKDIRAFDRWLVKKQNLERLLPFPRCVLAFQVRRNTKERQAASLAGYIDILFKEEADKLTYLYLRNGRQVSRLGTGIEFGKQLFPDLDKTHVQHGGQLYAQMSCWDVERVITQGEYETVRKDSFYKYEPYSKESVFFDDISQHLKEEIDQHNRLVLVLQGLLDRSPTFLPHPAWRLWEPEGFAAALKLVYDDSRALVPGAPPDFEAYRRLLNEEMKVGSVTIGQEAVWELAEGRRETARMQANWRYTRDNYVERYRPYGNPGPGTLARVAKVAGGKAVFRWFRQRVGPTSYRHSDPRLPCTLSVEVRDLLNVSAYRPGDFKQFFADPRTRANYLVWAPMLLEAEEYHAGHRPLDGEPPA